MLLSYLIYLYVFLILSIYFIIIYLMYYLLNVLFAPYQLLLNFI